MNKALLDTDTLSEIGKGIDTRVTSNAIAYRQLYGCYTFSTVTVMEVIRGFQRKLYSHRLQNFGRVLAP